MLFRIVPNGGWSRNPVFRVGEYSISAEPETRMDVVMYDYFLTGVYDDYDFLDYKHRDSFIRAQGDKPFGFATLYEFLSSGVRLYRRADVANVLHILGGDNPEQLKKRHVGAILNSKFYWVETLSGYVECTELDVMAYFVILCWDIKYKWSPLVFKEDVNLLLAAWREEKLDMLLDETTACDT